MPDGKIKIGDENNYLVVDIPKRKVETSEFNNLMPSKNSILVEILKLLPNPPPIV